MWLFRVVLFLGIMVNALMLLALLYIREKGSVASEEAPDLVQEADLGAERDGIGNSVPTLLPSQHRIDNTRLGTRGTPKHCPSEVDADIHMDICIWIVCHEGHFPVFKSKPNS